MARGKSRKYKAPPPDTEHFPHWFYWLTSHSLIHGGMVAVITGVWWLGLAEMVLHWVTDYAKCEGWIGFHTDQGVHVGSKLLWWALLP